MATSTSVPVVFSLSFALVLAVKSEEFGETPFQVPKSYFEERLQCNQFGGTRTFRQVFNLLKCSLESRNAIHKVIHFGLGILSILTPYKIIYY